MAYRPTQDNYQNHTQWQDVRSLYDMIESLQNEVKTLKGTPSVVTRANTPSAQSFINGIPVSGSPTNGQTLKYSAAKGELYWG